MRKEKVMERPLLTENARLIESYYYLYQTGIFTDREFAEIKKRLLERDLGGLSETVKMGMPEPHKKMAGAPESDGRRKTKNCAVCGKEFTGYSASRYCSNACRERAKAEKKSGRRGCGGHALRRRRP